MRAVRTWLSCGVAIATTFLTIAAPQLIQRANAAGACGTLLNLQVGTASNQYSGTQPMTYEGARATISNPGGFNPCSPGDTRPGYNFTTTWVMWFSSGPNGAYAQSGYMYRYGYSCTKLWAEQNDGTTYHDYELGGCASTGTSHSFTEKAVYSSGSWHEASYSDSTVIHTSVFNPFAYPTPYQVAFDAETYYAASDVAGSYTTPQEYTNKQVQNYADDQFYTTSGNVYMTPLLNQNSARWSVDAPCCAHSRTWTN